MRTSLSQPSRIIASQGNISQSKGVISEDFITSLSSYPQEVLETLTELK